MYFDYSCVSNFLNDLLKATLSIGGYIEGMNREKFTAYCGLNLSVVYLVDMGNMTN